MGHVLLLLCTLNTVDATLLTESEFCRPPLTSVGLEEPLGPVEAWSQALGECFVRPDGWLCRGVDVVSGAFGITPLL